MEFKVTSDILLNFWGPLIFVIFVSASITFKGVPLQPPTLTHIVTISRAVTNISLFLLFIRNLGLGLGLKLEAWNFVY